MENVLRKMVLFVIFVFTICFSVRYCLNDIKITVVHDVSRVDMNHKFDFGGNLHKPIVLQFSDPGYPLKINVTQK